MPLVIVATSPEQVFNLCNQHPSTIAAMIQAERTGHAHVGDVQLWHAGYAPGAPHLDASTSHYRMTWA